MKLYLKNIFLFMCLLISIDANATEKTAWGNQALYKLALEAPKEVESLTISDGYSGGISDGYSEGISDGYSEGWDTCYLFDHVTDADFEFLAKTFPNLKQLNIKLTKQLTDQALDYLADLPYLTSLSIAGYENLTDDGLSKLVTVAPQLQELSISAYAPSQYPNLNSLSYPKRSPFLSKGVSTLLKESSVESLTIDEFGLSPSHWVKIFTEAPRLKKLILNDESISAEALFNMTGKAPQLQFLHLKNIEISVPPYDPDSWHAFFTSFPMLNEIILGSWSEGEFEEQDTKIRL